MEVFDVVVVGGRCAGSPLAAMLLAAALGDYLTRQGQSGEADRAMVADAGPPPRPRHHSLPRRRHQHIVNT